MRTKDDFLSKVVKLESCWVWRTNADYPSVTWFDRRTWAHRLAYELFRGKIPNGLQLDHLCRNRKCVNPDHLEPVTRKENIRRGICHHRGITHCPKGHEYTEENTYRSKTKNHRSCKTCLRAKGREFYRIFKSLLSEGQSVGAEWKAGRNKRLKVVRMLSHGKREGA